MKEFGLIERAEEVAPILSAIANGKRLVIMCHLVAEELTVGEIAQRVDLSQSALSQHLAKLRALDLVVTRRSRQMVYYSCRSHRIRQILHMLDTLYSQSEISRDAARP